MQILHQKTSISSNMAISKKVLAAILITIAFWSTSYVGIRVGVRYYSPETLAAFRFIIASVFLGIYAVITKMRLPDLKDLPLILFNGFIGFFLYNLILNMGTKSVTAGVSSFLISTAPLFTTFFSIIFLKEKINVWGWFGIVLSFLGIGIITFSENSNSSINSGVLLVLFASILISLYNIFQKHLLVKYKPVEATTYCIWSGTLFMLIFIPKLVEQISYAPIHIDLVIVYLGIFPAAIGYILWSYALSKTAKAGNVASFMYLTPMLTLVIGWISIREIPHIISVIGGFVVLGGMLITNIRGK